MPHGAWSDGGVSTGQLAAVVFCFETPMTLRKKDLEEILGDETVWMTAPHSCVAVLGIEMQARGVGRRPRLTPHSAKPCSFDGIGGGGGWWVQPAGGLLRLALVPGSSSDWVPGYLAPALAVTDDGTFALCLAMPCLAQKLDHLLVV